MTRRSKLEAERIAWTALQGAIGGAIGAPVLGLSAWQSIGVATIMAAPPMEGVPTLPVCSGYWMSSVDMRIAWL